MICDNGACQYYRPMPAGLPEDACTVRVAQWHPRPSTETIAQIMRHAVVDRDTREVKLFLCGCCTQAVVMVRG